MSGMSTVAQQTIFGHKHTTLSCGTHLNSVDDAFASAAAQSYEYSHGQALLCDDSNMSSMLHSHELERCAHAQHVAEQHAKAQQYATSFQAKSELALATLTASKVTGQLLLDCLAHAAAQRMRALDAGAPGLDATSQQQQMACMGIWRAAAAAVRIPTLNFLPDLALLCSETYSDIRAECT
jgi:hypothetical protein